MTDIYQRYSTILHDRLIAFGFAPLGNVVVYPKLLSYQPDITIKKWAFEQRVFMTSLGCSKATRNPKYRYEFIIYVPDKSDYYTALLNFVMFFHCTHRDVYHAEVLEIGTQFPESKSAPFSHVYTSVPYFLPPPINFIELEGFTFALNWLVPIQPLEADFVMRHGADAFESRMDEVGIGFFDERLDLSYLNPL